MALDQSALLELSEALRTADSGELMRMMLLTMLQSLVDAEATAHVDCVPDSTSVHAQYDRLLQAVTDKLPKVAEHLDAARRGVLALPATPRAIRRHIWSNKRTRVPVLSVVTEAQLLWPVRHLYPGAGGRCSWTTIAARALRRLPRAVPCRPGCLRSGAETHAPPPPGARSARPRSESSVRPTQGRRP